MGDWPNTPQPLCVTVHPYSLNACGGIGGYGLSLANFTSSAWTASNRAVYMPFWLNRPETFVKLFCMNGATASGNVDMGIYDYAGTRIVSIGTTAQSGTNALQEFDITDTQIGPGKFYLALAMDNTTGTIFRTTGSITDFGREAGFLMQESAFALPATATFAAITSNSLPLFGATTRSVV